MSDSIMDKAFFVADYRRVSEMADGTQVLRIESDGMWQKLLFDRIGFGGNASKKHCWVAISLITDEAAAEFFKCVQSNSPEKPDSSTIRESRTVAKNATVHEHGDYAQKLYKSGFFLHEEVWRALGSDDQFLAWIRTQPSCIDGDDYNVVACHVRRVANGAGTAIKPPYSAVPMTQAQHQVQTSPGEMDCLNQWKVGGRSEWTAATAKTWFDRQRLHYVQLWAKTRLKEALKAESLADIAPERIRQWCEDNMVSTNFLPTSDAT